MANQPQSDFKVSDLDIDDVMNKLFQETEVVKVDTQEGKSWEDLVKEDGENKGVKNE